MLPNKAIDQILKENKMKKVDLSADMGKSRAFVGKALFNPNMQVATIIKMLSLIGDGYELTIRKKNSPLNGSDQIVLDMDSDDK